MGIHPERTSDGKLCPVCEGRLYVPFDKGSKKELEDKYFPRGGRV